MQRHGPGKVAIVALSLYFPLMLAAFMLIIALGTGYCAAFSED
jgi:hypothetical protein